MRTCRVCGCSRDVLSCVEGAAHKFWTPPSVPKQRAVVDGEIGRMYWRVALARFARTEITADRLIYEFEISRAAANRFLYRMRISGRVESVRYGVYRVTRQEARAP